MVYPLLGRSHRSSLLTMLSILVLASAHRKQDDTGPIHLGPFTWGEKGLEVKPQFKVGFDSGTAKLDFGIGDVRDGFRIAAKGEVRAYAKTEAHTVKELHHNIELEDGEIGVGFKQALEVAKRFFGGDEGADKVAELLHMNKDALEQSFEGQEADAAQPNMTLRIKASLALGASAQLNVGLTDTQGYRMVGAGGEVSSALSVGANVFAGRKEDQTSIKIILGISNFDFVYTLPTKPEYFHDQFGDFKSKSNS